MAIDIKDAQELFNDTQAALSEIYEAARDDLDFVIGINQWSDKDKNDRAQRGLPALTINRLPQFVRQVVNDVRMNTPSINVLPVDGDADIETAKIMRGIIKHIEYSSNADAAYDTAVEYAVKCGIGFIKIDHDYSTETGFEQELYIKRVVNPLSIYLDAASVECDGRDAMYSFQLDAISAKEFKKKYKGFNPTSFGEKKGTKDDSSIILAEHYYIDEETRQIAMMDDGSMVDYEDGLDGVKTVRKLKKRKVRRCLLSGDDILEETTFPGAYIPVIPVYGEEHWSDGRRYLLSLIRQSKDAQRRVNYWASKEMEILKQAPVAPIMAAAGQTEDWAADWRDPERAVVLRYKSTDSAGNPIAPPQRLAAPTPPTGIINAMQGAVEDMKATMGLYDAAIGRRSNETSGVAIQARKQEGDVATFHFGDNLVRSLTQVGRVLVGSMPEVYDTARIIRIVDDEETPQMVGINGASTDGQKQHFKIDAGQYDVRVSTGASFTTQRQEGATALQQIIQAAPELMTVAGDLLAKNMDFPGAPALAARMKKMVPPQLLSDEEQARIKEEQAQNGQGTPDPEKEQMANIIQQGAAHIQELEQQLAQLQAEAQNKQMDVQIKAQSEMAKAELDRMKLELDARKLQLDEQKLALEAQKAEADTELRYAEFQLKAQGGQEDEKSRQTEIMITPQGMEMRKTPEMEAAEQEKEAQAIAAKQAELMQQQQIAAALIDAVNRLTATVDKPKQVVRDASGKVVGVE